MSNSQLDSILNTAVNSDTLTTEFIPCPKGQFLMTPMSWKKDTFPNKKEMGAPDWVTFKVKMRIDNADVAQYVGRDEGTVEFKPFIGLDSAGNFDEGRNIALGQFWNATGANEEGIVSTVMERMEASMGVSVGGIVSHRMSDDGETAYPEIARIVPAEGLEETPKENFPVK